MLTLSNFKHRLYHSAPGFPKLRPGKTSDPTRSLDLVAAAPSRSASSNRACRPGAWLWGRRPSQAPGQWADHCRGSMIRATGSSQQALSAGQHPLPPDSGCMAEAQLGLRACWLPPSPPPTPPQSHGADSNRGHWPGAWLGGKEAQPDPGSVGPVWWQHHGMEVV